MRESFLKYVCPSIEPKDVNWKTVHLANIEEKVYGESALKDLMRPAKNPLGKGFFKAMGR